MKPNIVSAKFREVLCSNFNTVVFNIYFFILDFQTKFKVEVLPCRLKARIMEVLRG